MDVFWASLWGALFGALVGAAAAWLFTLDLRRRDRRDHVQDRAMDKAAKYEERIRELWDSLVVGILEYRAASTLASVHGKKGDWFALHRRLLTVTNSIRTIAEGDDGLIIWFLQNEFAWEGYESDKASRIAAVLSAHTRRDVDVDQILKSLISIAYSNPNESADESAA
jgi:hypothetical protein